MPVEVTLEEVLREEGPLFTSELLERLGLSMQTLRKHIVQAGPLEDVDFVRLGPKGTIYFLPADRLTAYERAVERVGPRQLKQSFGLSGTWEPPRNCQRCGRVCLNRYCEECDPGRGRD